MFINKLFSYEIEELTEAANSELLERVENIVWPSEASADLGPYTVGECKRSLFYKMLGQRPSDAMSVRSKTICEAGNMYEALQVSKFKKIGMEPEEQVKVNFRIPTSSRNLIHSGKIDLVINDGGVKKALEIKSYSSYKSYDITGSESKIPLPAVHNLMQTMLYKYWASKIPEGKAKKIEEVYLMYVNRNDGSVMYFKVDLDSNEYPIITPINYCGRPVGSEIRVADYPSYQDFLDGKQIATTELGRIAELRVSVNDIFTKFDQVCELKEKRILPSKDYKIVYDHTDLDKMLLCGRITKRKHTMLKKETSGDFKCASCLYQKKCLNDSGVSFK